VLLTKDINKLQLDAHVFTGDPAISYCRYVPICHVTEPQ